MSEETKFTKGILKLTHGVDKKDDCLTLTANFKWGKSEASGFVKYDTGEDEDIQEINLLGFILKLEFSGPVTEYTLTAPDTAKTIEDTAVSVGPDGRTWSGGGIFDELVLKFSICTEYTK